jgi:peptidoglycan/xylan/chitin deacetylase (PgdA/CDA1 family)
MTARRALLASILAILIPVALFAAPAKAIKKAKSEAPPESDQPAAVVLCYHVVEGPSGTRFEISREMFRQHLRYLEMTGYNVIPLQHLYEYVAGKRDSIPKNAVVITIDDGWRSAYTEAWPELKKSRFPFTLFIYPNIIDKTPIALSWKQVREMSDAGVDIQSHSLSHPFLTRRKHRGWDDETYAKWLRKELRESRRLIEKETGRPVKFIAYPYGDFDDVVAKQTAAAGYDAALTCIFGKVKRGSDPLRINRVVIDKKMDFAAFRTYLGARPMQLAEMTPAPKTPVNPTMTTVSAKIPNFQSLDPQTVGMALLSAARALPFSYDAKDGSISIAVREAISSLGRSHRAIVWGIDRKTGKRVEASWTFLLPDPKAPPATPAAPPAAPAPVVGASMVGGMGGGGVKR